MRRAAVAVVATMSPQRGDAPRSVLVRNADAPWDARYGTLSIYKLYGKTALLSFPLTRPYLFAVLFVCIVLLLFGGEPVLRDGDHGIVGQSDHG